ncbi:hypothetical protein WGT02_03695 [Rhizobium sp. T1470]|uniref:hypothetical protein n=1 Tax=unclassified Rhizobium TaxID=2613769 RepID=UPI001AAF7176|nr:hypothetical protein [Rhizobium sp. T1473]MCA0800424.1 hypothetical protein [Rhizobium sp. T1473]
MLPDRMWLAQATYRFIADWAGVDIRPERAAAEYQEQLQEIAVSTAHFLGDDREHGRSFAEEDELMFDFILQSAGLDLEAADSAREYRRLIIRLANSMLDLAEHDARSDPGNDPGCDPGGGMISPDDKDKGDPW